MLDVRSALLAQLDDTTVVISAKPERHGAGTGIPFQFASVHPSVGFPVTTTCAVLGSGTFASDISAFFAFMRTQNMIASPWENATGFVSPLS